MHTVSSSACLQAAAVLEAAVSCSPSPHLMALCARCLHEIAGMVPNPGLWVQISRPFFAEASRAITLLCESEPGAPAQLYDVAFALLECFAVMAKEAMLQKGTQQPLPAQGELMDFFESCDEWSPDDGTLVSQYYYRLLA